MGMGSTCHLDSSAGCVYVNDIRNRVMWQIEQRTEEDDGTITVITEEAPAALLRCETHYCQFQSSLFGRHRRTPKEVTFHPLTRHYRELGTMKVRSTQAVFNLQASRRRSGPIIVSVGTVLVLGKFDTSPNNNFLKFTVTGSQGALSQELTVVAHCLPDPPGHLDHLSSSDELVRMPLSGSSQTKCLQLKGRVHLCKVFAIRFSVHVQYYKTQNVHVIVRARNTYSTLTAAQCPGEN